SRMNPRRGTPLAESEWRGSRKPWPRTGVSGRTAPPTSRRSDPHPDDTERRESSNPRRSNGCRATLLLSWRRSKRPRSHDRGEGGRVDIVDGELRAPDQVPQTSESRLQVFLGDVAWALPGSHVRETEAEHLMAASNLKNFPIRIHDHVGSAQSVVNRISIVIPRLYED